MRTLVGLPFLLALVIAGGPAQAQVSSITEGYLKSSALIVTARIQKSTPVAHGAVLLHLAADEVLHGRLTSRDPIGVFLYASYGFEAGDRQFVFLLRRQGSGSQYLMLESFPVGAEGEDDEGHARLASLRKILAVEDGALPLAGKILSMKSYHLGNLDAPSQWTRINSMRELDWLLTRYPDSFDTEDLSALDATVDAGLPDDPTGELRRIAARLANRVRKALLLPITPARLALERLSDTPQPPRGATGGAPVSGPDRPVVRPVPGTERSEFDYGETAEGGMASLVPDSSTAPVRRRAPAPPPAGPARHRAEASDDVASLATEEIDEVVPGDADTQRALRAMRRVRALLDSDEATEDEADQTDELDPEFQGARPFDPREADSDPAFFDPREADSDPAFFDPDADTSAADFMDEDYTEPFEPDAPDEAVGAPVEQGFGELPPWRPSGTEASTPADKTPAEAGDRRVRVQPDTPWWLGDGDDNADTATLAARSLLEPRAAEPAAAGKPARREPAPRRDSPPAPADAPTAEIPAWDEEGYRVPPPVEPAEPRPAEPRPSTPRPSTPRPTASNSVVEVERFDPDTFYGRFLAAPADSQRAALVAGLRDLPASAFDRPALATVLRSVLTDDSWRVRQEAVRAVEAHGVREALVEVRQLAADGSQPLALRLDVIRALGRTDDHASLPLLENLTDNTMMTSDALTAIRRIGKAHPEALEVLANLRRRHDGKSGQDKRVRSVIDYLLSPEFDAGERQLEKVHGAK